MDKKFTMISGGINYTKPENIRRFDLKSRGCPK
jgi:hypothetical protein